jgi:hypothetical protein
MVWPLLPGQEAVEATGVLAEVDDCVGAVVTLDDGETPDTLLAPQILLLEPGAPRPFFK